MGEGDFFYCWETMWLIDHSEGEGVEGGYVPSHAVCSAETYPFLTIRFIFWTNAPPPCVILAPPPSKCRVKHLT